MSTLNKLAASQYYCSDNRFEHERVQMNRNNNNVYQCNSDEMEVVDLDSNNESNDSAAGHSTDEEIKCIDNSDRDEAYLYLQDIEDSFSAIKYFDSGLDGNQSNDSNYIQLKQLFHLNPLKWCQIINFLIQIHYDTRDPDSTLKPNIISLSAEYIAYLTNSGYFNNLFEKTNSINQRNDIDIRQNYDIRMALFEAVKYDQGFQMNVDTLFDLSHYPKPMVFSNNKYMFNKLENGKENNEFTIYNDPNDNKSNDQLIDWLRIKEIEFCNKIDWKFSFSTRYQTLMLYLKRLGFDTDCIMSQQYKRVKTLYNQLKTNNCQLFSDNIKFGFLCRFLLEMTYYKPDFYSFSKNDLIVAIIYTAYIIAQRWKERFNFNLLLNTNENLYKLLDNKHPINNEIIYSLIKKMIRIGRLPHSCFCHCVPIYYKDAQTGDTTHYHSCKCILNCCLNTYLKYGKIAFCEISKVPCLSTANVHKFAALYDNKTNEKQAQLQQDNSDSGWEPVIRAFASNKSVL